MFHFAIEDDVAIDASASQLTSQNITEDPDWAERLRNRGESKKRERFFRVENVSPKSVEEAVSFVQGILFHAPTRVWLGDEEHEVSHAVDERTRKPTA